jgi:hypothetical protein
MNIWLIRMSEWEGDRGILKGERGRLSIGQEQNNLLGDKKDYECRTN